MSDIAFSFDSRLDGDFLEGLYEGDKEHASMIFEQFLQSIHAQLKEVEDQFNSGNSVLFGQKVHKLKPVFSFVGLTWLTGQAELIESQCKQHSGTGAVAEIYNEFKNNIVEFIPVIENELVKLKQ